MKIGKGSIRGGEWFPVIFMGSPVWLVASGLLTYVIPVGVALVAGTAIGLAAGAAFVLAIKRD